VWQDHGIPVYVIVQYCKRFTPQRRRRPGDPRARLRERERERGIRQKREINSERTRSLSLFLDASIDTCDYRATILLGERMEGENRDP